MNEKPLLPLVLVTGFLGSGKTTFVRHLLRDAGERGLKVGVVINEFGVANIDGAILRASGAQLVGNLAGGCACCSSAEEMIWTMLELGRLPRDQQPDAVILESSGMADPMVMLDCLTVAALLPLVRVASVVALFDAQRLTQPNSENVTALLDRQAALADWLLVTKSDRAFLKFSNESRARAERRLRDFNLNAPLQFAKGGAIALDGVWAHVQHARRDKVDAGTAVHGHAQSVVVPIRKAVKRAELEQNLRDLGPEVWRAKGFVNLRDEGLFLVQYSGMGEGQFDIEPFDTRRPIAAPPSELVFIGPQLDRAALTRTFGGDAFLSVA